MMTRTSTAFVLSFGLLSVCSLAAQTGQTSPRIEMPRQAPPMPPRDTSARPTAPTPEVGTATLSGRVVAADTGQPLRRATVSAMSTRPPEAPRGGMPFQMPRGFSARTDDDGRYTIRQLPAGEYNLTARRAGYVELTFGQVRTGAPGRRITVADGAAVGPLDFQLPRGGVITGRVVDDTGEPAERVSVRAMQQRRMGGQTRLVGGQGDQTDDLGHFRIYGLPPGDYVLVAEPGDRRGPFGGGSVQGLDVDTVPTYGPGSVSPAEAMKVQVQAGLEASMDIQLVTAKVATVRGRVLTSKGEPLEGGFIRLQQAGGEMAGMGMGQGGPVMGGGQFEIAGVAPGTYMLSVQQMTRMALDDDGPAPEAAMQTITVEGEDLFVPLTTSVGSTARGRVMVEGDASALADRQLRLFAFAVGPQAMGLGMPGGRGRVAADQSFEMTGLRGEQAISVQGLPEGWWLKDVKVSGQSAIDGFDFGNGRAVGGVEITLSSRPTGLTGTVTMPTGATAGDYAVVLFPEDEDTWEQTRPSSGARIMRPGLDGTFRMPGVRPGSYYVLAVPADQAEMQALSDPDQLRTLAGRARTVEVKDGQMLPVTLTLVGK